MVMMMNVMKSVVIRNGLVAMRSDSEYLSIHRKKKKKNQRTADDFPLLNLCNDELGKQ